MIIGDIFEMSRTGRSSVILDIALKDDHTML